MITRIGSLSPPKRKTRFNRALKRTLRLSGTERMMTAHVATMNVVRLPQDEG